ncbi:MAG: anhydro-N-acetylmuramic acid kinase [Pseudomonadota bacterium]
MNPAESAQAGHFVGLMSGTSMDAVDAALLDLGPDRFRLVAHHSHPLPKPLRAVLARLSHPGALPEDAIDLLGAADRQLGEVFAEAALALLAQARIDAGAIRAIGSHGQTVRHRPPDGERPNPFSLQIGDPHVIAARTGIVTVADFRRRDLVVGGQGAPLVPPFHRAAFHAPHLGRAIINVGGIANLTLLAPDGTVSGCDIGPGNCLLDGWIQRHLGLAYDDGGSWAAAHAPHPELLQRLLRHPFLALPPPKSTGREAFHLDWLDDQLARGTPIPPGRVQATLLELTASAIAAAVRARRPAAAEVYLCGGGARNRALLERLRTLLRPLPVATTAALGLDPDWVEAAAFAWLARQTLLGQPGNLPAVTGASRPVVLGAIYPA